MQVARRIVSLSLPLSLVAIDLPSQAIIAQASGLSNPQHVIDFGAGLYPNFTPITTQFPGITVTHARYFTTGVSNNLVGGFLTNDFSGPPDTLTIRFANPITDLSFVYHQIGTSRPSNFRAMLGSIVVDSFSNLSNQTQTNNHFGFTNVFFDELQLDFVADFNVDTLAYNDAGGARCALRNGSGVNPQGYRCVTRPVLGTNWQVAVTTTPNTVLTFLAFAPGGPSAPLPFLGYEILVQTTPAPIVYTGMGTYNTPVPTGAMWLGFMVATQAVRLEIVGPTQQFEFLNALDIVLGL